MSFILFFLYPFFSASDVVVEALNKQLLQESVLWIKIHSIQRPAMVAQPYNVSTWETGAGESCI